VRGWQLAPARLEENGSHEHAQHRHCRLTVSKILNHAEGGVTKVYDRYAADPEKIAAMERWANRLREIVSGEPMDNVVQLRTPAAS
jgi:hypothetical protein